VSVHRTVFLVLTLAAVAALVPFAWVARVRAKRSAAPPIHLVMDMDVQPRYDPQEPNPMFADRRAMRPPVDGTIARGEYLGSARVESGIDGNEWVRAIPVTVTPRLLARGRERYDVFCAPCHGLAGYGDGPVSVRALERQQGAWVPPLSFHEETVRSRPAGHLYNTITHGIRNMPPYGSQIPIHDRWAIVAYVRALQRSQSATIAEVPADERRRLLAEERR
jgi:mono/diheme cytochrome c family protein